MFYLGLKRPVAVFFFAFSISLTAGAQSCDIREIRALFYSAHASKKSAQALYKKVGNATPAFPLLLGYKGIADLMMCYHTQNPYTKLKYFQSGRSELENAINIRKNDAELRFLRFCVQCNTPAILQYNNIQEDKKALMLYLESKTGISMDNDLYKRISEFLIESDRCSDEEKKKIRQLGPTRS